MNLDEMERVWTEDDAIGPHHPDYEAAFAAYRRLSGNNYSYGDAVKELDCGDEFRYLMPDGWVIVASGAAESRIYRPK